MPFWIFWFTNPIALFIFFIVYEIQLRIKSVSAASNSSRIKILKWRLLMYGTAILISLAAYWQILFTRDYHPSPVDASPIAQLTDEQVGNLRNALEAFRNFDFITRFTVSDFDNHPFLSESVSLTWFCVNTPGSSLNNSVQFYLSRNRNAEDFHWVVDMHYTQGRRFTHINNTNDTELILYDAYMSRRGHIWPTDTRLLSTQIRMGNARIRLIEHPNVRHLDRNLSNEFIHLLSELLANS